MLSGIVDTALKNATGKRKKALERTLLPGFMAKVKELKEKFKKKKAPKRIRKPKAKMYRNRMPKPFIRQMHADVKVCVCQFYISICLFIFSFLLKSFNITAYFHVHIFLYLMIFSELLLG